MSIFSPYHFNFLKALVEYKVKFLIVGGQAAVYYGVRRGTGDLDLLIEPTRENGNNLLKAFKHLHLQVDDIRPEEFEKPLFLGLGFEPDAVDILTITPGVDFQDAYRNARKINEQNLTIKIISLEDLIANKESMMRKDEKGLIDKYDIEVLKKIIKEKGK